MNSPSGLPDLVFVERDVDTIESNFVTKVEAKLGTTLALGDPRRAVISTIASLIAQSWNHINITGRQNLLGYAEGDKLPAVGRVVLGANNGYLAASKALTTLRITLTAARAEVTPIAAGSLVAAGKVLFEVVSDASIPIGDTTIDVLGRAVEAGTAGNGFVAGQINAIVNPIPYVATIVNLTTSQGGAPQETVEAYRERVQAAVGAFSVAGPEEAYAYWAKSASAAIADVSVKTDPLTPGEVVIYSLLQGGEIPGAEVLALVLDAVNDRTRRPLTDLVTSVAPTVQSYNIGFTYYVDSRKAGQIVSIQDAVAAAVDDFRAWQEAALGRDINPDELRSRVIAAGAKRLVVTSPAFTVLTRDKVAQIGTSSVVYGGLEDA